MATDNPIDPWEVAESDFPRNGTLSAQLQFLLHYAVLAPSTYNTQPWRFRVLPEGVELYVDTARGLPVADPHCRELVISCGAALFFLRMAFRHFHHREEVSLFPEPNNPNLLARIAPGSIAPPTLDEEALFKAIPRRHSRRLPFRPDLVVSPVVTALTEAAAAEGAWLRAIEGHEAHTAVAHLVEEADVVLMNDKRYRAELAEWLRPNSATERDGLPGYAFGLSDFKSTLAPLALRFTDRGGAQAAHDRELAEQAPVLAVLGTTRDEMPDWLQAGQALGRVLLLARSQNVLASFLNAPLEVPALRQRLMDILHRSGMPQMLLRMGHGADTRPTPRRPVGDVLME